MANLDDLGSGGLDAAGSVVAEPLLFDGQRLDQPTFHQLYLRTPAEFRAELINGVVHLRNGPVRFTHGRSHVALMGLLYQYSFKTPGTSGLGRNTILLDLTSEVEPDVTLIIGPVYGGLMRADEDGFLVGGPDLVVEVADETREVDLHAKKDVYERAGVAEYLVFDVPDRRFHWFVRREGRFEPMRADQDGLFRSRHFPGLWLDPEAFLRDDGRALLATLGRGVESPEHAEFVARLAQNRANRP